MSKAKIDRDKLRVQLRGLRREALLEVLDCAVGAVPGTRLAGLTEGYLDPIGLTPERKGAGVLVRAFRTFEAASLRGDYYEDFFPDSRNFMEKSRGTETWIAECVRLFELCADSVQRQGSDEVKQAFDVLFGLLDHVDECLDDVVFFASEGGSWQVSVDWRTVLPVFFDCLAPMAGATEYERRTKELIESFGRADRDQLWRKAQDSAKSVGSIERD